MRRAAPRPLSLALDSVAERLAPATPLAHLQRAWPGVVGEVIAREARPVSERAGVVTVACGSAVWAQELDLMAPSLLPAMNAALAAAGAPPVTALRCRATPVGITA